MTGIDIYYCTGGHWGISDTVRWRTVTVVRCSSPSPLLLVIITCVVVLGSGYALPVPVLVLPGLELASLIYN